MSWLRLFVGSRLLRRADSTNQLAWVDAQALSQLQDVVQRDISLSALYLSHEGPVQANKIGELFLALAEFVASRADTRTKRLRCE